jgi:hypothetical protein
VVPFFISYWFREVRLNGFRFTTPGDTLRQLEVLADVPIEQRLQRLVAIIADSLELPLTAELRTFFAVPDFILPTV